MEKIIKFSDETEAKKNKISKLDLSVKKMAVGLDDMWFRIPTITINKNKYKWVVMNCVGHVISIDGEFCHLGSSFFEKTFTDEVIKQINDTAKQTLKTIKKRLRKAKLI